MRVSEYQEKAARTLIDKPDFELTKHQAAIALDLIWIAVQLGVLAEKVKKGVFHHHRHRPGRSLRR